MSDQQQPEELAIPCQEPERSGLVDGEAQQPSDEMIARSALDALSRDTLETPLAEVVTWPSGDQITDAVQTLSAALDRLVAAREAAEEKLREHEREAMEWRS